MDRGRSLSSVALMIDLINTADVINVTGFGLDSLTSDANGKLQTREGQRSLERFIRTATAAAAATTTTGNHGDNSLP